MKNLRMYLECRQMVVNITAITDDIPTTYHPDNIGNCSEAELDYLEDELTAELAGYATQKPRSTLAHAVRVTTAALEELQALRSAV